MQYSIINISNYHIVILVTSAGYTNPCCKIKFQTVRLVKRTCTCVGENVWQKCVSSSTAYTLKNIIVIHTLWLFVDTNLV